MLCKEDTYPYPEEDRPHAIMYQRNHTRRMSSFFFKALQVDKQVKDNFPEPALDEDSADTNIE